MVIDPLEEAILEVAASQEKATRELSDCLNSIDVPVLRVVQSETATPPTLVTDSARRAVLEIIESA